MNSATICVGAVAVEVGAVEVGEVEVVADPSTTLRDKCIAEAVDTHAVFCRFAIMLR
ncbi:unannotated protein [freshwater metagenome]|uniref:Unannotated protein n=1 Tax=freshwater metagenome TaxID=449393 RepID=A0A6J6CSD6_9ZZZZ